MSIEEIIKRMLEGLKRNIMKIIEKKFLKINVYGERNTQATINAITNA
jgi:hypothetical protein